MNLNSLGTGKKLLKKVVDQGNLKNMRWTPLQLQDAMKSQKNPCNSKNRLNDD